MNSVQSKPIIPVVFFDGYCNLCTSSVLFIIRYDRSRTLRFASLQSEYAHNVLSRIPYGGNGFSTLILLEEGKEYYRSDAALRIARYLKGPWRYLWYAKYIPKRLRDAVYNIIARHRFSIFGKREECLVPSAELKSRFMDESP